ncbi:gene transfer agent family protein [Xanthobacter sp. V4C-4]|uniref:gene transfer agent family protein n=1 Tax=Xanthobacter cornucopiae TaxID=3119924 RepID=UPI0037295719
MANARRGEIDAVIDDRPRVLVLTLGALAELESAFGAADLMALAERFERGRLSARDAARILHAGLTGAGEQVTLDEVERMRVEGGAVGCVRLVAALLSATFGAPQEGAPLPPPVPRSA